MCRVTLQYQIYILQYGKTILKTSFYFSLNLVTFKKVYLNILFNDEMSIISVKSFFHLLGELQIQIIKLKKSQIIFEALRVFFYECVCFTSTDGSL